MTKREQNFVDFWDRNRTKLFAATALFTLLIAVFLTEPLFQILLDFHQNLFFGAKDAYSGFEDIATIVASGGFTLAALISPFGLFYFVEDYKILLNKESEKDLSHEQN